MTKHSLARLGLFLFLAFPVLAVAQVAETALTISPDDLSAFAKLALDAVQNRNWGLLASLVVVGLVWAARKWGGSKLPFLATDRGGAVLGLVGGVAGAVVTALAAGAPLDLALLLKGLTVGIGAIGVFSATKKIAAAEKAGAVAVAPVTDAAAAVKVFNGPSA